VSLTQAKGGTARGDSCVAGTLHNGANEPLWTKCSRWGNALGHERAHVAGAIRTRPGAFNGGRMSEAVATAEISPESMLEHRAMLKNQIAEIQEQVKELDEGIKRDLGDGNHHVGRWSVTIGEKEVSRFDSTAFKKAHPDIASAFTKTKTETLYQVRELKSF